MRLYHFHLAIGARWWGYYIAPRGTALSELGCCECPAGWRPAYSIMQKNRKRFMFSHRIADQLSPHHDSQFSAFSTEVFIWVNQKHNRSSSHGAALADRVERKAAKHRSRENPTFDQRHDSDLMHIRPNSRRRTLPKVFGLYADGPLDDFKSWAGFHKPPHQTEVAAGQGLVRPHPDYKALMACSTAL